MSSVLNARSIIALLSMLQGTCAGGKLLVKSTGATATLPKFSHAIPIFGGGLHEMAILRVEPNPDTADGSWPITSAGVEVTVSAVQGGPHANLPVDTECRWDPVVDGLENTSEVTGAALTGGARLDSFASLKQLVFYDDLETLDFQKDLFRAQVQDIPAAVLAWASSVPADGSVVETLGTSRARLGRGKRLFKHEWHLFLITSRFDSDQIRRREGRTLADAILEVLSDQTTARGENVSSPQGIEVLDARVFRRSAEASVDLIRFTTSFVLERRSVAEYNDWMTSRVRIQTAEQGDPPTQIDVVDLTVEHT